MSIVVLKRKMKAMKCGVSCGKDGFSLNGATRLNSSSLVGASQHGRRRNYTPMKGAVARAHGGHCCGNYKKNIITARRPCTVDNIVKPSTVSNRGMLANRLRCCTYGSYPGYVVKNLEQMDYERYLQNKTGVSGSAVPAQLDSGIKSCISGSCPTKTHHYVKNVDTMDQSTYIKTTYLKNSCVLSVPTGESNVTLNDSAVITSGPTVFIVGGTYTFHFAAGDIYSIHGILMSNTDTYFTMTMPSIPTLELVGSGGSGTMLYTIFDTGAYIGAEC